MNNETLQNELLCNIARAYVLEEYARVGERGYYWEEWNDPEDDTTAYGVCSNSPPSEASEDEYQWSEVYSCEVQRCEVTEQSDEGVAVTVYAAIAIIRSCDEEDEEPEPEDREIYCWLEYDSDTKDWYVVNAEE